MESAAPVKELISCYDCGCGVSFSARSCPHCGSLDFSGPYVMNEKEKRLFRAEQENDRTFIGMMVLSIGVGMFLGALTGRPLTAAGYAFLGALISGPAAFIINLSRRFRR